MKLPRWGSRRRLSYVPQMEVAECGAACLSMVLGAYDHHLPLAEARELCGVSRDGVSALAIVRAARSLGCDARALKVSKAGLAKLPLPAILHWERKHFVVLDRVTRRGADIFDPATGHRHVDHAEFDAAFEGIVLSMQPGAQFVTRAARRGSGFSWMSVMREVPRPLAGLLLASLMCELAAIFVPAATQVFVDHVLPNHHERWLVVLVAVLALGMLLRVVLQSTRERLLLNIQFALDVSLTSRFVDHLVHLPVTYFTQRTAGDLSQRVDSNTTLREIAIGLARNGLSLILVLVYSGMMLAYDSTLASVALCASACRLLFVHLLMRSAQEIAAREQIEMAREQSAAVEALSAPEVVRAFGIERLLQHRFGGRVADRLARGLDRHRITGQIGTFSGAVHGISQVVVIWMGGNAVIAQEMTLGALAGFLVLQQLLAPVLDEVVNAATELSRARGILARIDDVFEAPRAKTREVLAPVIRGDIRFEGVSFRYGPFSPWVVRDVSFHIRAGEKVAFVGQSGHGKSTILQLLLGLLEPTEGKILIDDRDLNTIERGSFLAQVGTVNQDAMILDDTVRNNLALRRPEAQDEELLRVVRLACLEDVVASLPEGLETRLGPGGQRLSGGQRQRLGLARALVGSPRLLVLDESTSALDAQTERVVHGNLEKLACTRVIVAHRLSTVRDAHRIFVVDQGAIVDEGTFGQLMARPGILRSMQQAWV